MSSMESISDWLRREIIIQSGGWLADIVPLISDATSIWDIYILSTIFVGAWVILRISDSLTSLILGLGFDLTIPLQHYMSPNLIKAHQAHLDGYWPIMTFATGVEALCFFLIHPDLFTLVVCLKTTLMTAIWLARRPDGSFITTGRGVGQAFSKPFPSTSTSSAGSTGNRSRSGSSSRSGRPSDTSKQTDSSSGSGGSGGSGGSKDRRNREREPRAKPPSPSPDSGATSDDQSSKKKRPEIPPPAQKTKEPSDSRKDKRKDPGDGTAKTTPAQGSDKTPAAVAAAARIREADRDVFAPPGLGPQITAADLEDDRRQEALQRKRRGLPPLDPTGGSGGGRDPRRPSPIPLSGSNGSSAGPLDGGGSSGGGGGGGGSDTNGLSFFERFKRFKRTDDQPTGQAFNLASDPEAMYSTRGGGKIAVPGMTTQQDLHGIGQGNYKGIYIDESDPDFQCDIDIIEDKVVDGEKTPVRRKKTRKEKRGDGVTAAWERALDHDSIDLLHYYLKAEGVHEHVRGWMVMDMLEEKDENVARRMARAWKEVYMLPLTSGSRKDKMQALLEPYRGFLHRQDVWRPAMGDWWSRARLGPHGGKIDAEYGLDDILWRMRQRGVSPAARNAMVRDLLSQPSEAVYLKRREKILQAVDEPSAWADEAEYKKKKDMLVKHFQEKDSFGGKTVISQRELAEIAEEMRRARIGMSTIARVLKEIRWNLPEGGWRGVMKRIEDAGGL